MKSYLVLYVSEVPEVPEVQERIVLFTVWAMMLCQDTQTEMNSECESGVFKIELLCKKVSADKQFLVNTDITLNITCKFFLNVTLFKS